MSISNQKKSLLIFFAPPGDGVNEENQVTFPNNVFSTIKQSVWYTGKCNS